MTLRVWMLLVLLAAAGACVVRGVAILSTSGAWIAAGVVIAGLGLLALTDVKSAG